MKQKNRLKKTAIFSRKPLILPGRKFPQDYQAKPNCIFLFQISKRIYTIFQENKTSAHNLKQKNLSEGDLQTHAQNDFQIFIPNKTENQTECESSFQEKSLF